MENSLTKKTGYEGDLVTLLQEICLNYKLGDYLSYKIIVEGYEDFNLILISSRGKYLVKMLSKLRNKDSRQRYLEIMKNIEKTDIQHPKLLTSKKGLLYESKAMESKVYLFVLQYIDGKSLYSLKTKPNTNEIGFIVDEINKIKKIKFKPNYYYDNWSLINLPQEFVKNKKYLNKEDISFVNLVCDTFSNINYQDLPHTFVHGDLLDTNIIMDKNGNFWIIDFSVANYYPRILELAVFLSGPCYDPNNEGVFCNNYDLVLKKYQKDSKLSALEIKLLPTFIMASHAQNIVGASRGIVLDGNSDESKFWLENSRKGLVFTKNLFSK